MEAPQHLEHLRLRLRTRNAAAYRMHLLKAFCQATASLLACYSPSTRPPPPSTLILYQLHLTTLSRSGPPTCSSNPHISHINSSFLACSNLCPFIFFFLIVLGERFFSLCCDGFLPSNSFFFHQVSFISNCLINLSPLFQPLCVLKF